MSTSSRIKYLRESNNMTQVELGKIAGVSDKAVSTWENGAAEPRMGAIQKIADYFGVSKGWIIDDEPLDPSSSTTSTLASDSLETQILTAFHKLNDTGKHRAIQNVEDLTGNEKYTSQSYEEDKGGELLNAKVV